MGQGCFVRRGAAVEPICEGFAVMHTAQPQGPTDLLDARTMHVLTWVSRNSLRALRIALDYVRDFVLPVYGFGHSVIGIPFICVRALSCVVAPTCRLPRVYGHVPRRMRRAS